MKTDNPANRILVNVTLGALCLPLYAIVLLMPEFGLLRIVYEGLRGSAAVSPWVYLCAAGIILSFVWLLIRGRILGPMALFLTVLVGSTFVAGADEGKRYELLIGAGRPTLGVDVYCNDVYLGKTPLRISREEFHVKVKPWQAPPRQPRFSMEDTSDSAGRYYYWAKYYYIPNDIFERWEQWPPDHNRYNRGTLAETLKDIAATRYWWHFEKDGCVGLGSIANFDGGGGGGRTITIEAAPQIVFLSDGMHLTALLDELSRNDYRVTDEWVRHFRDYSDLLFMRFYEKAQADARLQPALDAVVRAEFEIPEAPTRADCARVIDTILERAERDGCFTVPSLESLAVGVVGRVDCGPIVDRFIDHAGLMSEYEGRASSDTWTTWRRSGKAARQLPLEYAVRTLRPAALFDRLVYLGAKDNTCLELVANYRRPETVQIIDYYLRQVEEGRSRAYRRRFGIENTIAMCTRIDNPELDERFCWFLRENAGSTMNEHIVRQFIESRASSTETDKGRLAEFVYFYAPMDDQAKLECLCRIDSPASLNYIRQLTTRNDRGRSLVMEYLGRVHNPSLDDLLIESCDSFAGTDLAMALINADSEKIRRFLEDKWNDSPESRKKLIDLLRSVRRNAPHMAWLLPLIRALPDSEKAQAAGIVANISTDEAWALLKTWAGGDNGALAGAAKWYLDGRAKEGSGEGGLADKARDLIAGRIKPDELLEAAVAYVWTDAGYVPQTEAANPQ